MRVLGDQHQHPEAGETQAHDPGIGVRLRRELGDAVLLPVVSLWRSQLRQDEKDHDVSDSNVVVFMGEP